LLTKSENLIIQLNSTNCPTLKALLKIVTNTKTNAGLSQQTSKDDNDILESEAKNFAYDLDVLYQWHLKHHGEQIVVVFQDSEAFDPGILTQAIEIFQ
jgi:origin recognition complex subunit 3